MVCTKLDFPQYEIPYKSMTYSVGHIGMVFA